MVTVLIADDSLYIRETIKLILSEAGHDVLGEASSAEETISQYKNLGPDVLLLDIVIEKSNSGKTGLDVLKEVMGFDPEANVILCSALEEQAIIHQAMLEGAKAFIAKPFEPQNLIDTLTTCTDLNIIAEIGNVGAGHAATTLSKLAGEQIRISITKLQNVQSYLAKKICGNPDRKVTAVHLSTNAAPTCDFLLALDHQDATKIAERMTRNCRSAIQPQILKSALEEMGSIIGCSFVSAMANFAEINIMPTCPEVITDSWQAVIDVFLAKQLLEPKSALILQVEINNKKGAAKGHIFMFPSAKFQEALVEAGKKILDSITHDEFPSIIS